MRTLFTRPIFKLGTVPLFLAFIIMIAQAQVGPVFRIGVLDSPNGPLSSGARLAVNELNDAGGVRGADGTFFRLELIIEPVEPDLATAITNLGRASVIAVIGPDSGARVSAEMTALQNLNVPVLTPATIDVLLNTDVAGRLFRIRAAEVYQGRALAAYLVQDMRYNRVATAQLDLELESTAANVGFSTAASAQGLIPQPALQGRSDQDLPLIVQQLIAASPQAVVVYGPPGQAAAVLRNLRAAGWTGDFAYNLAEDPAFKNGLNPGELDGIIGTTTWPYAAMDEASRTFRDAFVRLYGRLPGPLDAAAYDGIRLLAAAINLPGELLTNLSQIATLPGVQGVLRPASLQRGETGSNVAVFRVGEFGGQEIQARFDGSQRVASEPTEVAATPGPATTPTPEGVFVTIKQSRQNVRTGPSTVYSVLGQLSQGETARVVGATADNTWVVIDFRGQNGWLATYLLDVTGSLNTVPIITPPPTPTPVPTPTAVPQADIVIDGVSSAPTPIIVGQPFIVSIALRNAGNINTGTFLVGSTFPPNNLFLTAAVPNLAPGQTTVATLTGAFPNTGFYSALIVADLNNQVFEGTAENNNTFTFSYQINKPLLRQGAQTLNPGEALDFEGNGLQFDIQWDAGATALNAIGAARLGAISAATLDTVHWDLITGTSVNLASYPRTAMSGGQILGFITADGNRGALRIDSIPGNQIQITFLVFQG